MLLKIGSAISLENEEQKKSLDNFDSKKLDNLTSTGFRMEIFTVRLIS